MLKTTVYLAEEMVGELRRTAKALGTSAAALIRTAIRNEMLGAPAEQTERTGKRARLLRAVGSLDSTAYPDGYLAEIRAGWRE